MSETKECCPRFDPAPWRERMLTWEDKRFVKARVRSFLRVPLNYGGVITRNMALIEKEGAKPEPMVVLSDENSLWGSDLYLEVTKDIPGVKMTSISGSFLAQAYEGAYRNIPRWIEDLNRRVLAKGKKIRKIYFYYTTCPVCAKKYGKNYVVLFAQI